MHASTLHGVLNYLRKLTDADGLGARWQRESCCPPLLI
jgi:hypothetical protein